MRSHSRGSGVGIRGSVLTFLALLALGGCQIGITPDPNDPNDVSVLQPEVLRNSLKGAADNLNQRLATGEIDRSEYERYMAQYANELLNRTKIASIPPGRAWEYAEVFRTAQRWQEAERLLKVAVEWARKTRNEDRRVNDLIRLAQVEAKVGRLPDAIRHVRETFDTPPQNKAPILIGTLLEVVPSGEGKGDDVGLAQVLEEAIPQAEQTLVDPNTESGQAFIMARPHHVRNAWAKVVELYESSGHPDLAQRAIARQEESTRSIGST